jgi:hypothetical protein
MRVVASLALSALFAAPTSALLGGLLGGDGGDGGLLGGDLLGDVLGGANDATGATGAVTGLVCGEDGAAEFLTSTQLFAAVRCVTTKDIAFCNNTELLSVLDLDALGIPLVDGLLGDVLDLVSDVLELVNKIVEGLLGYYGPIDLWCVGLITDFTGLFADVNDFNQELKWDLSSATSLASMFEGAVNFNQDLSKLDVSNVCDFTRMFYGATSFNQDLSAWIPDIEQTTCQSAPILTDIVKGTACPILADPVIPGGNLCRAL